MSEPIDWIELSRKIGQDKSIIYGSSNAMLAIEQIIGEDVLRQAVDHYVAYKPESELVRHVLWRLQLWSAMQRCYEIYRFDANIEYRQGAIELLRVVADARALDWIEEFLADPDPSIQNCGIGVLDQLVFGGGIRNSETAMETAERLLTLAEQHENSYVRETADSIRASLAMSEANEKLWSEITKRNSQNTS